MSGPRNSSSPPGSSGTPTPTPPASVTGKPSLWDDVPILGRYFERYGTAGFLAHLERRNIDTYRYKAIASARDYAYFSQNTVEGRVLNHDQKQEQQREKPVQGMRAKVEAASHDALPDAPKPQQAVDFDFLELLLPGYRSTESKKFCRLAEAPVYEPLPGPDWFRVLVIEPWRADKDNFRRHLRAVRLDDAVGKYRALSYCWAQLAYYTAKTFLCNGHAVPVGDNLRLALEDLRHSTSPRIVWADAICINQDDPAERSQQVQLMGKIYQQAAETIVWLGDVFTPNHFDACAEFSAICQVVMSWDQSLNPTYRCLSANSYTRNAPRTWCTYKASLPDDYGSLWFRGLPFDPAPIARLFRSPWFSRRWMIQEVALSPEATVMIPDGSIAWNPLPSLTPLPLLPLLRLAVSFANTDPRDAVYSLLSLADTDTNNLIIPDYTISPGALAIIVAKYCLAQHPRQRPLAFLADAAGLGSDNEDDEVDGPTWAPTWLLVSPGGETHGNLGGNDRPAMLDTWSLSQSLSLQQLGKEEEEEGGKENSVGFDPARGLEFALLPSAEPERLLTLRGVQVSEVVWRTVGVFGAARYDVVMGDVLGLVERGGAAVLAAASRAMCAGRDGNGLRDAEGELAGTMGAFLKSWRWWVGKREVDEEEELWRTGEWERLAWVEVAAMVCRGRCLFYTASGHVGLGPGETGRGDVVCILGGAAMPVVVRKRAECFGVVGDCYLDGVMDGEAVDAMEKAGSLRGPLAVDEEERRAQEQYEPLRLGVVSLC